VVRVSDIKKSMPIDRHPESGYVDRSMIPGYCWTIVALLVLLAGWLCVDPLLAGAVDSVAQALRGGRWPDALPPRCCAVIVLMLGIAATVVCAAWSLFRGPVEQRGFRSWLVFTAVIAVLVSVAVRFDTLAWRTKQIRLSWQMDSVRRVATALESDWPSTDGQRPQLGQFTAYPIGSPTTLILLTPPELAGFGTKVVAVERDDPSLLRMQLSGNEQGDWLELHGDDTMPSSFIGGLGDRHRLVQSSSLGVNWFLVRYVQSP